MQQIHSSVFECNLQKKLIAQSGFCHHAMPVSMAYANGKPQRIKTDHDKVMIRTFWWTLRAFTLRARKREAFAMGKPPPIRKDYDKVVAFFYWWR
jgi:hypothetical protein